MEPSIIVAIIGGIEAVIVAIIGGIITRNRKTDEEHQKQREERDAALYALAFANASGTEVLLHQAHGEKLNGNVEDALNGIQSAKSRFNEVVNRQAAKL